MNKLIFSCGLVFFLALFLTSCLAPKSMKAHQEFVASLPEDYPTVETGYIVGPDMDNPEFSLHYKVNGTPMAAVVVWIHGTPGSWEDGARLLVDPSLTETTLVVSIDRPGWGKSKHPQGFANVEGFQRQGELIFPLLESLKSKYPHIPLVLIGHSWGGSVVPFLAREYPHLVDGLIIAAGGMDPSLVNPRWYNRVATTLVASWVLPDNLGKANKEIYSLASDLRLLAEKSNIAPVPMIAIQGMDDKLVDPENINFIEEHYPQAHILRLEDQGHLLQFERSKLLSKCVLAMIGQILENCSEQGF